MKKTFLLFAIVQILFTACKKNESCSWGNSTLDGKTYDITSVLATSTNINVIDSAFRSDPCLRNKYKFSGSNYLSIKEANCSSSSTVTWLAKTIGDVEQLDFINSTLVVKSISCDEFTMEAYLAYIFGNKKLLFTYKKQ